MIILGAILLIIGLVTHIYFLWIVGVILLIIGLVLLCMGLGGRAGVGGRRHWF